MHTRVQLKPSQFRIRLAPGSDATLDELFPSWNRHDRFGIVIHDALGGVGASHLLQLAICCYYAADERRRGELDVYPEIFAFHVGGGHGSHADFDFWGPRREVILDNNRQEVLAAINDRGITRLAVPERDPAKAESFSGSPGPAHEIKEIAAFHDITASVFAYSPTGLTSDADVEILGLDPRTEQNPRKVLRGYKPLPPIKDSSRQRRPMKEVDPKFESYQARRATELTSVQLEAASALRSRLLSNGVARETYRRIDLDEALELLTPASDE